MHRCAGVQKVSRPMVSCHEISHTMPTKMQVAANTTALQYHGTRPVAAAALVVVSATGNVAVGKLVVSMTGDYPVLRPKENCKLPENAGIPAGELTRACSGVTEAPALL